MSKGLKGAKAWNSEAIHANLRNKLARLETSEYLDRQIHWMEVLRKATVSNIILLRVPETLVCARDGAVAFVYSDRDGIIRAVDDPRYPSPSASEQFLDACDRKHEVIKKANPHGLLFPKFLSFQDGSVDRTIAKRKELLEVMAQGFEMVQRYVVPADFVVKKLVVRWRRTKVTKCYSVTSTLSLRSHHRSIDFAHPHDLVSKDQHYFASLRASDNCRVTKEARVTDVVEETVRTACRLIETFGLEDGEALEEFIGSVMFGHDGDCYFLNCPRVRTSCKEEPAAAVPQGLYAKQSLPEMEELAQRLAKYEGLGKSLMFKLPVPDFEKPADAFPPRGFVRGGHRHFTSIDSFAISPVASPIATPSPSDWSSLTPNVDEVTQVANTMDKLCEQAKARKEVSNFLQQIKFKDYPPGFLQKCISRMYESVTEEPRLSKYFPKNGQMTTHIRNSMNQVFLGGRFVTKIKSIHKNLGITDVDFDLYLKLFATAFENEGASKEHTKLAVAFLGSFKELVVTRWRVLMDEGTLADRWR